MYVRKTARVTLSGIMILAMLIQVYVYINLNSKVDYRETLTGRWNIIQRNGVRPVNKGMSNALLRVGERSNVLIKKETSIASMMKERLPAYVITTGRQNVKIAVVRKNRRGIKVPTILVWRAMDCHEENRDRRLEFLLAAQCGGCRVTTERPYLKTSIAVVLFNRPDAAEDLPDLSQRNPDQVYVFWTRETPSKSIDHRSSTEDPRFDSIFNLTLYYRPDSDIMHYFGTKELALRYSKQLQHSELLSKVLLGKSKLAVWVVSNCYGKHGSNLRMEYATQMLNAGLELDTFGECFGRKLDRYRLPTVIGKYMFYLAFENSIHCPNYVTEKFWRNSLWAGLVPVVFGPTKEDVENIAPKHSFIHTDDFDTPADLVKYLKYLGSNQTAYMEYHAWRYGPVNRSVSIEDIDSEHLASFCRLCKRQVLEVHPRKTIPSVSKWLYDVEYVDDQCLMP